MRALSRAASAALVLCGGLLVAGCQTIGGSSSSSSSGSSTGTTAPKTPAAKFNLTGYSAAFKQGYADACATPRKRNAERFKSDTDYSMGWQDGQSACRAR
jgi:hypothetical protein